MPANLGNRAVVNREYDRWGNLTMVDDPRTLDSGARYRITSEFNANNQLIKQTKPQIDGEGNAEVKVYYDELGRQIGVKDARQNLSVQFYDAAGNVVQEWHADGGHIRYAYNAFGDKIQKTEVMDVNRPVITQYAYDKLSRLTSTRLSYAISAASVTDLGGEVSEFLFSQDIDAHNGVTMKRSDQAVLERIEYDEAGRRIRVINGANEATRYRYDLAGNLSSSGQESAYYTSGSTATALLYAVKYRYDAQGRKIWQQDANGVTQTWTYDLFGQLKGHTDQNGGATVTYDYSYNRAGQLINQGNNAAKGQSLDYRYDGAGQLIRVRDNFLGQTSTYDYDLAGNRIASRITQSTLLASGETRDVVYQDSRMLYDARNQLRMVVDGHTTVSIGYDAAGNRNRVSSRVLNTVGEWSM